MTAQIPLYAVYSCASSQWVIDETGRIIACLDNNVAHVLAEIQVQRALINGVIPTKYRVRVLSSDIDPADLVILECEKPTLH